MQSLCVELKMEIGERYTYPAEHIAGIRSKHLRQSNIDWEELVFHLRHLEIRILEIIYLPESRPLALGTLIQRTKRLNYSERTIRRKIHKLESLGLINVIRSTVTIINPILNMHKNIKTLTVLWNLRDRNL